MILGGELWKIMPKILGSHPVVTLTKFHKSVCNYNAANILECSLWKLTRTQDVILVINHIIDQSMINLIAIAFYKKNYVLFLISSPPVI